MTRHRLSALLIVANLAGIFWFSTRHPVGGGAIFAAIAAGVIVGAVVERVRFGPGAPWRARFDPIVVVAVLLAFDLALFAATTRWFS